jgi:prepilin-type N-terminal cleavage/methylation domain-containing protein
MVVDKRHMTGGLLSRRGFSLVEIAIVLVVVGLLVSGGLIGLAPVLDNSKIVQTNAQMDKIEQALVLYVIQNGCLPCPAAPAADVTGEATDSTGSYTSGCGNGVACSASPATRTQGPVPWINLGLSRDDVLDAYGSYIDYIVAADSATGLNRNSTSMVRTPPSTYPTAPELEVQNAGGTVQTTSANYAAYVLISHGKDRSDAYHPGAAGKVANPNAPAAAPSAQGCNVLPQVNCSGTLTTDSYVQDKAQGSSATGGYFDDIVRFKTAPVIIQSCGSNACGNPA